MPAHIQGASYAVLAVFVAAIAFGLWGIWQVLMGPGPRPGGGQAQVEALAQQVATLTRSDQISREANRDLQGTLAERDEEIAALRADVAFYERFVGSTAQRRGLTVHELVLTPRSDQAWHYTATLTQNLNRGAVSSGRLSLSLEGTRDGRLEQLDWDALRQDPEATGVEYSFKYFQQVEGEIVLPPGFAPLRIRVRLAPASGAPIEQTLPWDEVARAAPR
ncbi:DUF6776 family protein [Luteimonas sp. SDU101]|uniref:DUF6776 family protein n=1 Tax=Luteimonas sp. SDU101 TaxID=3422593 RepID=UPI003EBC12B4